MLEPPTLNFFNVFVLLSLLTVLSEWKAFLSPHVVGLADHQRQLLFSLLFASFLSPKLNYTVRTFHGQRAKQSVLHQTILYIVFSDYNINVEMTSLGQKSNAVTDKLLDPYHNHMFSAIFTKKRRRKQLQIVT